MLLVIRRDSPSVAGTEAQAQAAIIYGRTMRAWLLQVPVLYPFGHGLAYTSFTYSPPQVRQSCSASQPCLEVTSWVRNTGMIQPCATQIKVHIMLSSAMLCNDDGHFRPMILTRHVAVESAQALHVSSQRVHTSAGLRATVSAQCPFLACHTATNAIPASSSPCFAG